MFISSAVILFGLLLSVPLGVSAGTLAPGYDCATGATAPIASYSIPVSSLAVGSIAANSLSLNFLNATADTVDTNSSWTSSPTKYLMSSDAYLIAKSKYCSRDMEIDSWTMRGIYFLRLTDNGDGYYLLASQGSWSVGIVKGFVDGNGFWRDAGNGSYYELDFGTIPGFKSTGTESDHITFGAEGFDIYLKYNGTEFWRIQDYRQMAPGRAAIQAQGSARYGLRDVTVNNFANKTLLSDPTNNILDPRDFGNGMRETHGIGSITAGSNHLVLNASAGFQVGDYIIVEIGGEVGGGHRGSVGVGGVWPYISYPSLIAMNADTSKPDGTYAWVPSNSGNVYWIWSGVWSKVEYDLTSYGHTHEVNYYFGKGIPVALPAQITAISADGRTLTLSAFAVNSTTNANVYYDNSYVLNKLGVRPNFDYFPTLISIVPWYRTLGAITPAITIKMPAGIYALGQEIWLQEHPGIILQGAGTAATTLFSPKGAPSATIVVRNDPHALVCDFTLKGNFKDEGYGLNWWSYHPDEVTVQSTGGQPQKPNSSIRMDFDDNSTARNIALIDPINYPFTVAASTNTWVYNSSATYTVGQFDYWGWTFNWTDSTGGGCVDCSVTSPTMIGGFQSFKSEGTQFIRAIGVNAHISMNDAGNFLVDGGQLTMKANSINTIQAHPWQFPGEAPVQVGTNIGNNHAYLGGKINNLNITVENYIDAAHDSPSSGINIGINNPNVSVIGGSYTAPTGYTGAYGNPEGVLSTGANTIVDGFHVTGRINKQGAMDLYHTNIGVSDGVIKNCVADSFMGPTIQSCTANTSNSPTFIYNLAGTAPSDTQVNLTWSAPINSSTVSGYQIFRNDVQIATTTPTATSYFDTGLSAGITYTYRVAAYNHDYYGDSLLANSGSVTVTPRSTLPTDTTAPSSPQVFPARQSLPHR